VLVRVDLVLELRRKFEGAVGLACLACLDGGGHALVVRELSLVVAGELFSAFHTF
jgi:hypothetical protein